MKVWAWIKSIGWLALAGAVLTAILMVLAGAKATRLEKRANKAETDLQENIQDGTKKELAKAEKQQAGIAKDKAMAAKLKAKSKVRLEKLGDHDDTLADLADNFNKRVRD